MNKRNIEAIYPLSPMQQGLLFHSVYAPESGVYIEQMHCTLRGALDVAAFRQAWQRVIERQSVLRTCFVWQNLEKALQVVQRQVELPFAEHNWRHWSAHEQQAQLEIFLKQEAARGFDLAKAPLLRLTLLRTGAEAWRFVFTHHHLLLDGWSLPLLFREVFSFYAAFAQGQELSLPPVRPYRDYINWLQKQNPAEAELFWRQTLSGLTTPTPLPLEHAATEITPETTGYQLLPCRLPATLTEALQQFVRKNHITLNTLIQGAWALLLARYSGESDVVFGATVSGRPAELPGVESMVGLFINSLPVRATINPQENVLPLLRQLQLQQAGARFYEFSSLVQIQGWSQVPRTQPLFESLLVFENYPVSESLRNLSIGLQAEDVQFIEQTNYPLTLVISPEQELLIKFIYDRQLFDEAEVSRLSLHMQTLLESIIAEPQKAVAQLSLLSEAERRQILTDWNDTARAYPRDLCLHHLFEAQVARTPDAVALVFEDQHLTYQQLSDRADLLARCLQSRGVGPEVLVGVCAERSLEMVIALYAILRAGGAYLPLDPGYPADRLAFMLADSQARIVLTQSHLQTRLAQLAPELETICLDTDQAAMAHSHAPELRREVQPEHLAYVIYTSGSTGQPKGSLIEHRSIVNRLLWMQDEYQLQPGDVVLQKTPFSFDVSVWEFFWPLLCGARLVLARPDGHRDSAYLVSLIQQQQVTTLHFVPPMLSLFLEAPGVSECQSLRRVICSGEALPYELQQRFFSRFAQTELHNLYGPTEAAVDVSYHACERDSPRSIVPIGRPVANTQLYILDAQGQPVPVGVAGELHLGGVQLARGYLNRPELTAEKFVELQIADCRLQIAEPVFRQSAISNLKSAIRLYRTGDQARWLSDGEVEYLGRLDHQVKIRGFRIELGEIEAVLGEHAGVREAVVVAREDKAGDRRLVAYLIAAAGGAAKVSELREYLGQRLPDYMVPSAFVVLEAFPLSPNGKVDRKALPAPDTARPDLEAQYVAPRTPIEEMLAGIVAAVLGLKEVSVNDNFFELGGHSLLAMQVISRVRDAFGAELPLRSLFEAATIADFARRIEEQLKKAGQPQSPPVTPVSRDGSAPLSFGQQRLWFIEQFAPGNHLFNIAGGLCLRGRINPAAFEQSLNDIIRRHEILRTTFRLKNGEPVQVIAPELIVQIPVTDLRPLPEREREAEFNRLTRLEVRRAFDLTSGPLLRVSLFQLADDEAAALLVQHHIISDGWSQGVMTGELAAHYEARVTGAEATLPELPIQYADYAHWQRAWLQGAELERQLAYWQAKLGDSNDALELPTDHPRPAMQTFRGATLNFALPAELSAQLKALSRREGVTLFMTLLAAFQTLLHRYTGQEAISTGTPISNRQRSEVEGLIGFFVNTLVLRNSLTGRMTFRELLKQVRETALGAYAHQDLPFEQLVERLGIERNLSHTPLFQTMFILQNAPTPDIKLAGLTLAPFEIQNGAAQFDLTLMLAEREQFITGQVEYNADLFEPATISRLLTHFRMLLEAVAQNPEQPLSQLPLLTETEARQMLVDWNNTDAPFPSEACFHQLFEQHALAQPDAIAVQFGAQHLTYGELNARADQLAHYLQARGVTSDTIVGICTERSLEMIVGILGVLKAGGAYLPLDPHYPADRLAFMFADSQARLVLTQSHLKTTIAKLHADIELLSLDADWPRIAQESSAGVVSEVRPQNLAYVIYTSGSTGQPKGTLLAHRGLCNLTAAQQQAFGVRAGRRVLQFSPFSFDASVWELAMALGSGATLVLARQESIGLMDDLWQLLRDGRITHVTLPPSVLNVLSSDDLPDLQVVVAAGERCTADIVARWSRGRKFFNAYGPTETTVCAAMAQCFADGTPNPPIGRPLPNFKLFVLDAQQRPVPIGVPGELCVSGPALARGYLNRAELTAEKFIEWSVVSGQWSVVSGQQPPRTTDNGQRTTDNGQRLYRTGDLVRWRADGQLEYLGRIDEQVKVRGFRIEPGEIENVLRQHPGVREAVIVAYDGAQGDKRLAAYLLRNGTALPSLAEMKNHLRRQLPEYMIPATFVEIESLPLSPSGKVDRKRLPAPDTAQLATERIYVAPRTELESRLAALWHELLGPGRIGVEDNFFELGGHSLLATRMMARVQEAEQVELPLRSFFEAPTIAALAGQIESLKESASGDLAKIAETLAMMEQLSEEQLRAMLEGDLVK